MYFHQLALFFISLPMAKCALSTGPFLWKPRLSLDLSLPSTSYPFSVGKPDKENIRKGLVVLIDSYSVGMTVAAISAGLGAGGSDPYLNPTTPYFFTNAYRWGLRYISLLPDWLTGTSGHFTETQKVWRRRFYYKDEFMPGWMKQLLFFIPKSEWNREVKDWKLFKKYSEPAFGQFYRYPNKHFNFFRSMYTEETQNVDYNELSDSNAEAK